MTLLLHRISGAVLLISHGLLIIRSLILLHSKGTPGKPDRIIMSLSQMFLPLTLLTGLVHLAGHGRFLPVHTLIGILPVIMMMIFSKRSFRRKHPLLLPILNGLLIAAAFVTGYCAVL